MIVREPAVDEADALAALLNAHSTALYGEADLSADTVRHWFDIQDIWMRVAELDGALAGYVDAKGEAENTRFEIDARALDDEAAAAVLGAAEAYAGERGEAGALLRGYADWSDERIRGAYERAGFGVVRHFFQMRTELADLQPPEWPDGIALRTFRDEDEDAVWECFNEAFADHWDHRPATPERRADWRHNMREGPGFEHGLWYLAEEGDELAGISLCAWHWSGDLSLGWVGILAVRRPWRRRGLALALLRHSFAEFARRGATRVGLGVDAANPTGAVGLYERAGMHVQRRSVAWEKTL